MSTGYGQFCPLALASEILSQKWTLLILRELAAGSERFSDIKRGVPKMSASLLKLRLDTLEQHGVVERFELKPGLAQVYRLSAAGSELRYVLSQISEWGQRWARNIGPEDLDPGWLVWNIHRRLDTARMPEARTVIQFVFSGVPASARNYWIVHEKGRVEVCLKPPDHDIHVILRSSVRALAEVWRGISQFDDEITAGRIQLDGRKEVCRALPGWLLLSVYAPIKSQNQTMA